MYAKTRRVPIVNKYKGEGDTKYDGISNFTEILTKFQSLKILYEDYTHHQDEKRRENYSNRASNIRGNRRNNPYHPNNLVINLLW